MSDVLAEICARRRQTVAIAKTERPLADIEQTAHDAPEVRGFAAALHDRNNSGETGFIAEIKRASPSAGLIKGDFDPATTARDYAAGGAAALSVLTEPDWFRGDPEHLITARAAVDLPVLRKDFMVDPYQCIEARAMGADCILIILAAVSDALAGELRDAATAWGLDCLFEVHDAVELERAAALDPKLLGINNRNLKTLAVDLQTSIDLVRKAPPGCLVISESGIKSASDVETLAAAGADGFLIGEALMRDGDPATTLAAWRRAGRIDRAATA